MTSNPNDADMREPAAPLFCERGTIGWVGDPSVVDAGSDSNDGKTLIKVTLFRGHPSGASSSADGAANGHPILAQLSWPFFIVPPAGMVCAVLFPGGDIETSGGGLIVGCYAASPTHQFSPTSTKLDFSGYDVVIKGASVTLIADDGAGKRHMMSVSGQGGCQVIDATGSGFICKDGAAIVSAVDPSGKLRASCSITQNAASLIDAAGQGMLKMKGGNCTMVGGAISISYGSVGLGSKASPATPVCVGPTGMAAIGSMSIFGSP